MENGYPFEDSAQLSWRQGRERLMIQASDKLTGPRKQDPGMEPKKEKRKKKQGSLESLYIES